jgi:ribosomal protein S27E
MSDINFSCPYCQNPLVVDAEGAGLEIPCPVCSRDIVIPETSQARPEPVKEVAAQALPGIPLTEEELDRLAEEIMRRARSGTGAAEARVVKNADGGRDISFSCKKCATHLVVDIDGAGLEIPCPSCGTELTIPDPMKDAETFFAAALASRLGLLEAPAPVAAPPEPVVEKTPEPVPAESDPVRTRIPLKPKMRTKKAPEPAPQGLPFLLPQAKAGEGVPAGLPEDLTKPGSGYVIVPIQTPNGPAAMITQAPATADEAANRKRPRYPRKYSELAAKLRSADTGPAGTGTGGGEALEELQKRGPLVSRLLAQHFIEKALEDGEGKETETPAPGTESGHKGALKSPQRLDLEGGVIGKERASRRVTGAPEPTGVLPPQQKRHHHHHHGPRQSARVMLTAFALIGGLVTLGALLYHIKVDADMALASNLRPTERIPPPTALGLKGEENIFLPKVEQITAKQAVTKFAEAATWEDLLPLVRQRDRVEPLMRTYYAERPYQPSRLQEVRLNQANYTKGRLLVSLEAITQDSFQELPFLLERTAEGNYLVDWEFAVEYNPYSWANFRKQKPTEEQTFRVLLTPADYYNYEFSDSRIYQSFKNGDRRSGFVDIYAFAKRDSEVAMRIEDEMRSALPLPCMVTLKYPANAQSESVVEITGFVRKGWMVPAE